MFSLKEGVLVAINYDIDINQNNKKPLKLGVLN